MKKMRKILTISTLVVCLLAISGIARATTWSDNFNDGVMNSSLWTYWDDGNPATSLYEKNGVLNFTSSGTIGNSSKIYASNWQYSLNNDISTQTDFNYSNHGTYGDVGLWIAMPSSGYSSYVGVGMTAESDTRTGGNIDYFRIYIHRPGESELSYSIPRYITNGMFNIDYNTLADSMNFKAFNSNGDIVLSNTYSNFRNLGINSLRVGIEGSTDNGLVINEGQAYLDNFVSHGTVTPEPVSSVLFLLGGGVLALRRYRKKAVIDA